MSDVKISVIVPVYNSEEYLPDTAANILNQSFEEFELILVDDGSKDRSGKICDELAQKDKRVKVIHKQNGGICSARNCALKLAKGEYIAFCDNDDMYLPGLLKDNYELAKKHNADVVRYSRKYQTVRDGKVVTEEITAFDAGAYSREEFNKNYYNISLAGEAVWSGIYKREFLEKHNLTFDESMKFGYEDVDFITRLYLCSPSLVMNPKMYYVWVMRYAHSTSGKTDLNNILSLLKGMEKKSRLIKQTGIEKTMPQFWVDDLSKKIYTIVRYVSPKKVKMPFKERMELLKAFRAGAVFNELAPGKRERNALRKKNKVSWIVYELFYKKQYWLLYFLLIGKQSLENS